MQVYFVTSVYLTNNKAAALAEATLKTSQIKREGETLPQLF